MSGRVLGLSFHFNLQRLVPPGAYLPAVPRMVFGRRNRSWLTRFLGFREKAQPHAPNRSYSAESCVRGSLNIPAVGMSLRLTWLGGSDHF